MCLKTGKFKDQGQTMPIVYEDDKWQIFFNSTRPGAELFVVAKHNGAEMRMSATRDGIEFTAFNGQTVEPIVVANSIGYRVSRNKPRPRRG